MNPVRLLLVDDHPIVLRALIELFQSEAGVQVVGSCASGAEAVAEAVQLSPDVVVLDVRLPDMDGMAVLRRLRQTGFNGRVIFLTGQIEDADALEAVRLGARGIVFKDQAPEELVVAVRAVVRGERWFPRHLLDRALDAAFRRESAQQDGAHKALTRREVEVVQLVGKGHSNKRIARELQITEGTVKIHLNSIFRKLDVSSRVQLAIAARELGVL